MQGSRHSDAFPNALLADAQIQMSDGTVLSGTTADLMSGAAFEAYRNKPYNRTSDAEVLCFSQLQLPSTDCRYFRSRSVILYYFIQFFDTDVSQYSFAHSLYVQPLFLRAH